MNKPIQTVEELDAVLHWRRKHALAIKERDSLQQRLTAADERADVLEGLLREASVELHDFITGGLLDRIDAAFKPAEGGGDERPAGCCCPPKGHRGIWAAAMCPVHHGLKARVALQSENQRIVAPGQFKCLACGEIHPGSGNLPCPKMSPTA